MKMSIAVWLWLLASIACYSTGEFFSKKIAEHFSWPYFWIILACYAGSGLFWIPAMVERNSLIVLGFVWTLLATISTLVIGFSMGETFNHTQIIGIILAVISVFLLST